ncbi:MAG: glycosyltransferase family 4 protein [Planctomycetota bacterium]|nr:glycosyltransferase family 4 protein [Planctomycetota bacterium]
MTAAFLVALPSGLVVSGVASWAVRLLGALVARGRPCGLILHASPARHPPLAIDLDPRIRVTDLRDRPPLEDAGGEVDAFVAPYAHAAATLAAEARGVVISPNLLGDCYAIAARAAQAQPAARIVGWLHSDIPYEYHVQAHFAPIISRFVPASRTLERTLASRLPDRAGDIVRIPHGVEMPGAIPVRPAYPGRPLRLVYAGRLDHTPKRVLALVAASDALTRRGFSHELAIVGDGPATPDVERAIRGKPAIVRLHAQPPARVLGLLAHADVALLASTFEGLSLAVIEAMSRGCVPVVTRTDSGDELIDDGVSGVIVDAGPEQPIAAVGEQLASGIERAAGDLARLRTGAFERARGAFAIDRQADAVGRLLDDVALGPARTWPAERPCAFAGAGGGSVPPAGEVRLRAVLAGLSGRALAVHGTGRHTIELRHVLEPLAHAPAGATRIVAFIDDDPARQGGTLWGVPVVAPERAGESGATDVVVSSWINQRAILSRRRVYEGQGLRVHAIYPGE